MIRKILFTLAVALGASASAQTLIGSADFKASLPLGFSVSAGADYRTAQWFDATEQWGIYAGLNYKINRWVKLGAGYKFIDVKQPEGVTKGGYYYGSYWEGRHRAWFGAQAEMKVWKLSLSLRERYQYTYRDGFLVPRFTDAARTEPWGNREVDAKNKHILRSRIQAEFKPYKKCRFTPYVSYELFSLLSENYPDTPGKNGDPSKLSDKWRITVGTSYKLNKHNSLELFYRYSRNADADDNESANIIGIGYTFKL